MIPYATFLYFGVVLCVVVPAVLLRLTTRRIRWAVLLPTIVMLAVHAPSGNVPGGGRATAAIAAMIVYALVQWLVAVGLLWVTRAGPSTRARVAFYVSVAVGLLPLVIVRVRPDLDRAIALLGLSYITFRSLDVVFSIRDGVVERVPLDEYLGFLLVFPTISAGPIDRFRRFHDDWQGPQTGAGVVADLDIGLHHIVTGFLYKFIAAALVAHYWMSAAAHHRGFVPMVSYMYAYSAYLFFDFAGYSAFAVGVSALLGVHPPENFQRPFLARNIRDFWDRWHISLSWWFRDHVYMRFLLAAIRGRWFPDRHLASYAGLVLSFGLMGVWHGPHLRYVLYGLYHATLLIGYDVYARVVRPRFAPASPSWGRSALATLLTAHVVCFGFLIFSGHLIP
jgi:membrane protein involved in D-alanine export